MPDIISILLTALGVMVVVPIMIKFLIGSMGKHIDRLSKTFEKQTDRTVESVDTLRKELNSSMEENARQHGEFVKQLQANEVRDLKSETRLDGIEKLINTLHPHFEVAVGLAKPYSGEHSIVCQEESKDSDQDGTTEGTDSVDIRTEDRNELEK